MTTYKCPFHKDFVTYPLDTECTYKGPIGKESIRGVRDEGGKDKD